MTLTEEFRRRTLTYLVSFRRKTVRSCQISINFCP